MLLTNPRRACRIILACQWTDNGESCDEGFDSTWLQLWAAAFSYDPTPGQGADFYHSDEFHGRQWLQPALRASDPGNGWESVRNGIVGGSTQPRHGVQNHSHRNPDHAVQFLRPQQLRRRLRPVRRTDARHRRKPLRDHG